jgi:hypothetical protein
VDTSVGIEMGSGVPWFDSRQKTSVVTSPRLLPSTIFVTRDTKSPLGSRLPNRPIEQTIHSAAGLLVVIAEASEITVPLSRCNRLSFTRLRSLVHVQRPQISEL